MEEFPPGPFERLKTHAARWICWGLLGLCMFHNGGQLTWRELMTEIWRFSGMSSEPWDWESLLIVLLVPFGLAVPGALISVIGGAIGLAIADFLGPVREEELDLGVRKDFDLVLVLMTVGALAVTFAWDVITMVAPASE